MIDTEKYNAILEEGLLLDHYALLLNIRDGKELIKNRRIQGFINLMCKKGYIEDGALTDKALVILDCPLGEGKPLRFEGDIVIEEPVKEPEKFDYATWVIQLHKKCEQKLATATGKRQVRAKIDGQSYSFLPNSTDLGRVIYRAVNTYKLKDFDKIEATILKYIDRCIKANKWFPILGYYIMKNHASPMVTDMDSPDDEETSDNASIHIV